MGALQMTILVEVNNTISCSDMDFMHTRQSDALCGTYKTCKMETSSGRFIKATKVGPHQFYVHSQLAFLRLWSGKV